MHNFLMTLFRKFEQTKKPLNKRVQGAIFDEIGIVYRKLDKKTTNNYAWIPLEYFSKTWQFILQYKHFWYTLMQIFMDFSAVWSNID